MTDSTMRWTAIRSWTEAAGNRSVYVDVAIDDAGVIHWRQRGGPSCGRPRLERSGIMAGGDFAASAKDVLHALAWGHRMARPSYPHPGWDYDCQRLPDGRWIRMLTDEEAAAAAREWLADVAGKVVHASC